MIRVTDIDLFISFLCIGGEGSVSEINFQLNTNNYGTDRNNKDASNR